MDRRKRATSADNKGCERPRYDTRRRWTRRCGDGDDCCWRRCGRRTTQTRMRAVAVVVFCGGKWGQNPTADQWRGRVERSGHAPLPPTAGSLPLRAVNRRRRLSHRAGRPSSGAERRRYGINRVPLDPCSRLLLNYSRNFRIVADIYDRRKDNDYLLNRTGARGRYGNSIYPGVPIHFLRLPRNTRHFTQERIQRP